MLVRPADARDAAACAAIYAPSVDPGLASFERSRPDADEMARRIAAAPRLAGRRRRRHVAGLRLRRPAPRRAPPTGGRSTSPSTWPPAHQRRGLGRALYEELLDALRAQGLRWACAGITLPNPASVGLHESLGFEPAGVYRDIGYKAGAWHDVGWWQLELGDVGLSSAATLGARVLLLGQPRADRRCRPLRRADGRRAAVVPRALPPHWWVLVLPLSIVVTIAVIGLFPASADGLLVGGAAARPAGLRAGARLGDARRATAARAAGDPAARRGLDLARDRLGELAGDVLIVGSAVTLGRLIGASGAADDHQDRARGDGRRRRRPRLLRHARGTVGRAQRRRSRRRPAAAAVRRAGQLRASATATSSPPPCSAASSRSSADPRFVWAIALFVVSLAWNQLFLVTDILPATVPGRTCADRLGRVQSLDAPSARSPAALLVPCWRPRPRTPPPAAAAPASAAEEAARRRRASARAAAAAPARATRSSAVLILGAIVLFCAYVAFAGLAAAEEAPGARARGRARLGRGGRRRRGASHHEAVAASAKRALPRGPDGVGRARPRRASPSWSATT